MRRARDQAEIDHVLADPDVALGIARVQREGGGRGPDPLLDEGRIEAHPRARRVDLGAGLLQDRPRFGQEEVDPDLRQHAERGGVDRLDLIGREDLERRVGIAEATRGRLRQMPRSAPLAPWSASLSRHLALAPLPPAKSRAGEPLPERAKGRPAAFHPRTGLVCRRCRHRSPFETGMTIETGVADPRPARARRAAAHAERSRHERGEPLPAASALAQSGAARRDRRRRPLDLLAARAEALAGSEPDRGRAAGDRAWRPRRHREDHHRTSSKRPRPRSSTSRPSSTPPSRSAWTVQQVPHGTGSGFVWDEHGHIVTNFHVIQGADAARVTLADQLDWDAKLVGAAPDKDLAVLTIEAPAAQLHAAPDRRRERPAGRPAGVRHRQSVRPRPHAHHRRDQRARPRDRFDRRGARSATSSRPTPRSIPATPAARCSTAPAG